jgi:putative ABC transport system permease protein
MSHYAIKITGGETRGALAHLEKTWKEFCPEKPLEFHFLDQRLHALYRSERNASAMVRAFSVIAILVSCLGLYGLSVHTAERRTKEIGIRKTLGATVRQIFVLLSAGFMKPVAVANLLAWPLAYAAANRWLEQFAYHVSLHTGDFIFGTVIGMAITLVTVTYQTWRASTANPVEALKYE